MFRPILATSLILLGASAGTAQLPSIIGMGADNAAGVLGYCVKNRLVDATSATLFTGETRVHTEEFIKD